MTDSDKPAFAQAMATMAIALREKEPDAPQMKIYFKALSKLEIEFVVAAAEELGRSSQWFPKTSEWHETAQRIERDRTIQLQAVLQKRRRTGEPLCAECEDTCWRQNATTNRFERCPCAGMRRLEVLGRRPMPQLPAGEPDGDLTQEPTALALAAKHVKAMR